MDDKWYDAKGVNFDLSDVIYDANFNHDIENYSKQDLYNLGKDEIIRRIKQIRYELDYDILKSLNEQCWLSGIHHTLMDIYIRIVNDEPFPEERKAEYVTINFSVKGKMVEPTEQHMNYSKKYLTKLKEILEERNGIK